MLNRNLKKSPIRSLQQFQRYIEADDSFNGHQNFIEEKFFYFFYFKNIFYIKGLTVSTVFWFFYFFYIKAITVSTLINLLCRFYM